jgi:DNA-directed RNA polymerase subunit RPC12/RpoP
MVKYECKKCGEIFDRKSTFDDHLDRKTPCKKKSDSKIKCEYCSKPKYFSRKDSLNRHIKNIHSDIIKKSIVGDNNNNSGGIVGDNNSIINNTINQYYLLPFGEYQIDDLSTNDKLAIFSPESNPIETIVIKTHLNPDKKQYHNCGIKDKHSGVGNIYDGEAWKDWRISDMMNILIESGQENSLKIYDKIKHFLQDVLRFYSQCEALRIEPVETFGVDMHIFASQK